MESSIQSLENTFNILPLISPHLPLSVMPPDC